MKPCLASFAFNRQVEFSPLDFPSGTIGTGIPNTELKVQLTGQSQHEQITQQTNQNSMKLCIR